VLEDEKRLTEAEPLVRRALEVSRRVSGPRHLDTLDTANDLGLLLMDAGRLPESLAVFADLVKEAEAGLPVGHRFTAVFRRNHGRVLARLARYREAERELLRAQADLHVAVGDAHRDTVAAVRRLVELYDAWGRPAEASAWKKRLPPA
jgi:tetratricopeptide repeat protein